MGDDENTRRIAGLLKNQRGISILAIVLVFVVLAAIGYTFSAMMVRKQISIPVTLDGGRAFYVAEGGIQFAQRHLSGLSSAQWAVPPANETRNLGGGSFTVVFSNYVSGGGIESLDATSTGTYGTGTRELVVTFTRPL
jgi:hypothetical protein